MTNNFVNLSRKLSPANRRLLIPNLVLIGVLLAVSFITVLRLQSENTNLRGRAEVPPPPYVVSVSGGGAHTCALMSDSTIRCWGDNSEGQLGAGNTAASQRPVSVINITSATALSASSNYSCALLADGTIKCWGNNTFGQLGNGTTESSATPVEAAGIATAKAVSTAGMHACALLADGTIKCWGDNTQGQLGNGTTESSLTPVPVADITTAIGVSSGLKFSCALLADSTIKCWGANFAGQLGDGTSGSDRLTPVSVLGIENAKQVSAGYGFTCALLSDSTVKCWGANSNGQLANGATAQVNAPSNPIPGLDNAVSISAGYYHTCALLTDSAIKCWGSNYYGQLGDGNAGQWTNTAPPVYVSGITNGTSVDAGYFHSCSVIQGGTVKCWGDNYDMQLGDATTLNRPLPVKVLGLENSQPVLDYIPDYTVLANQTLTFTLGATDFDTTDILTYSINNLPSGATFDPGTHTFSWTPTADQVGTYPAIEAVVTDNGNPPLSASQLLTIYVYPPNAPLIFDPVPNQSVNINDTLTFTMHAVDPEGLEVTYFVANVPNGAVYDTTTGVFTWTPTADQIGVYYLNLYAYVENSDYDKEVQNITITVNDLPTPTPTDTPTPTVTPTTIPTPTIPVITNLLTNPGFETNNDWTYNFYTGSGTITRTTDEKHSGSYSYRIKGNSTSSSGQVYSSGNNKIKVTAGTGYSFSAWYKGKNAYLVIKWFDKYGKMLTSSNFSLPNSSVWSSASAAATAPDKAVSAWVFVQSRYNNTATYFDDLTFTANSTPLTPTQNPNITPTSTPTPKPTATPTPTNSPTTPTPTPAAVNGLTGTYYNNNNFTGTTVTRIDPTINFNWGTNSPVSGISANTYSAVWTGYVIPQYSQEYKFYFKTDDGARVWVNGVKLIDSWKTQPATEYSGKITLSKDQRYAIRIEYFQNYGGATAQMSWSSSSQAKQIVPQDRLNSK